jgi:hypothetical protein
MPSNNQAIYPQHCKIASSIGNKVRQCKLTFKVYLYLEFEFAVQKLSSSVKLDRNDIFLLLMSHFMAAIFHCSNETTREPAF